MIFIRWSLIIKLSLCHAACDLKAFSVLFKYKRARHSTTVKNADVQVILYLCLDLYLYFISLAINFEFTIMERVI